MQNPSSAFPGSRPRKTILVVDDTPENILFIGGVLQPYFRVIVANNGVSALKLATAQPAPDLILLDIMMPEMDGYQVLQRLRRTPNSAEIPVIFVTAMETEADETRGLALGAVDYITKPVVPGLLLARIQAQLELKEARDWLKDRNALLTAEVERQTFELRKAMEASEAASRSKSIFISTMSHELRTPMNAVIGMVEVAQTLLTPESRANEFLSCAAEAARSMNNLLSAILDYADLANDKVKIDMRATNVRKLVHNIASIYRSVAQNRNLDFLISVSPDVPELLLCDEALLNKAMAIFLNNAVKFTESGSVELGVELVEGGLRIRIRDSGIGIVESNHERIFRPFEQVDGSMSRRYGGAGLGLAIAKRLIELMDGTIELISAPGTGSEFDITLPVQTTGGVA